MLDITRLRADEGRPNDPLLGRRITLMSFIVRRRLGEAEWFFKGRCRFTIKLDGLNRG